MFIPPHCVNPECRHYQTPQKPDWYRFIGYYPTITFGMIPRFRCRHCGKSFSTQTFSIDYYAKKRLDYQRICSQINNGGGIRFTARMMKVKPDSIINRINRMARNAVVGNQMIIKELPFEEDLVIDGLQNFCGSQYFPDNYTILVGKDSQFVYEADYATVRRGGSLRPDQKAKRAALEKIFRAESGAIRRSFERLLDFVSDRREEGSLPLIIYTDEKKDYLRAFWNTTRFSKKMFRGDWRHHRTNSKVGRNTLNPLFAVNYIDREIRKDMASQARETVQFPRNAANAMLRMNLYFFDHNVWKPYRIRDLHHLERRHSLEAGLERSRLEEVIEGFFSKRFFVPRGLELSQSAMMTLNRQWVTPLKKKEEHVADFLAA